MCSITNFRLATSCIARVRGLLSGLKLYNYNTLRHMDCQWQMSSATVSGTKWGDYRSVRRSILENLNIQSVITVSLQQRLVDFVLNKQLDALFIEIYSVIKLYMFRASSVHIIRSYLLYIRHCYASYWNCVIGVKLLIHTCVQCC